MTRFILETDRLLLREMHWADYPALCKILRDPAVMHAYEGPFSHREAVKWLRKQRRNYKELGFGLWAVVLKDTGKMIGQCGLTTQNTPGGRFIEVGYLFQKAHWHKGYATEAAIACRDFAFDKLNVYEIVSIIRDTNTASQNVAKRNGMAVAGEFVKHYRGVDMPHYLFLVRRDT